ncbi:MAG: aldehyde dehydrogenase family protein [Deltaproteobacteria bacterium]|nr:aldehyde dehydrogenase family protein [Deltaproteobacteria bacterium]MBI4795471.1 aldehyde dehydrogenase family protein [Deltaproteobacteria bacterium]
MADTIAGRLELLAELGEALARRRNDLIEAQGDDIGAPCRIAGLEVDLAVEHLRTMAVEVPYVEGKSPYGTVAAVFPYDAAPVVLARVGGGAILGGNRLRFSCSSQTPRTARLLAEMVAPFPELQVVVGLDNRTFGQQCVQDPEVRVLFISGGGAVGAAYANEAAAFDKIFFAGPSGLPPVLLFRDAPLQDAVNFLVRWAFVNGGQYCTSIKRVYLHEEIFDEVRRLILARLPEIKVGDPRDPATWIGPIKTERTRKLLDRVLAALKEPRFLATPQRDGQWQGPFLVDTPEPPDLELFGPFLALTPVDSDAQAVAQVLSSRYPFLVAWFGTPPPGAREALTETFGMVYDNVYNNPDFLFTPLRRPFGGKGESGWIIERRNGRMVKRDGAFIYSAELVRE